MAGEQPKQFIDTEITGTIEVTNLGNVGIFSNIGSTINPMTLTTGSITFANTSGTIQIVVATTSTVNLPNTSSVTFSNTSGTVQMLNPASYDFADSQGNGQIVLRNAAGTVIFYPGFGHTFDEVNTAWHRMRSVLSTSGGTVGTRGGLLATGIFGASSTANSADWQSVMIQGIGNPNLRVSLYDLNNAVMPSFGGPSTKGPGASTIGGIFTFDHVFFESNTTLAAANWFPKLSITAFAGGTLQGAFNAPRGVQVMALALPTSTTDTGDSTSTLIPIIGDNAGRIVISTTSSVTFSNTSGTVQIPGLTFQQGNPSTSGKLGVAFGTSTMVLLNAAVVAGDGATFDLGVAHKDFTLFMDLTGTGGTFGSNMIVRFDGALTTSTFFELYASGTFTSDEDRVVYISGRPVKFIRADLQQSPANSTITMIAVAS